MLKDPHESYVCYFLLALLKNELTPLQVPLAKREIVVILYQISPRIGTLNSNMSLGFGNLPPVPPIC